MKAGIGKRNKDVESITGDSTPDKLVLIPDEVNTDRTNTDDPNPENQED